MPTIVAMCPYCRAGGVRAPESAVGASATCPKCKSSFTVMPSEGLPGWAKERVEPRGTDVPPIDETRPTAVLGAADVTEPSPLLAANEQPQPAEVPQTRLADEQTGHAPADLGLVVGLVALILVGVAVIASQFPFGRLIAAGIAGAGLLGGVAALGSEGRGRLAGGAAIGLHALVLLVVLLLPSWLSLEPWRSGAEEDDGPKVPMVLNHQGGQSRPQSQGEWIEAAASSWQLQDVRVTLRAATIGPEELTGPNGTKRKAREPYLHLHLRVANAGVEREIPLSGWAAGHSADGVRITDSNGKPLKAVSFEDGWKPDRGKPSDRLFPGKVSEVYLLFAAPPARADGLRIQLPASAIGFAGEDIRFQIRPAMDTRGPTP